MLQVKGATVVDQEGPGVAVAATEGTVKGAVFSGPLPPCKDPGEVTGASSIHIGYITPV